MAIQLNAIDLIDPITEAHYALHNVALPRFTRPHTHDFFEMFLVVTGDIIHHINGDTQPLANGHLVLIRPQDHHYFERYTTPSCQLMNIAFFTHTYEALINYLKWSIDLTDFVQFPTPPSQIISEDQVHKLVSDFSLLYQTANKFIIRAKLRALLATVLVDNFRNLPTDDNFVTVMPAWLKELCQDMQNLENFREGRAALMRLSGYSPEYVTRCFKKYLQQTPTHYINQLRLKYAANLLAHTDMPITEISLDVGFSNLSHFYHLFVEQWAMPPRIYRQNHQRNFIP